MKGKIFRKASSAILAAAIASNCLIAGSMNSAIAADLTFEFEDSACTSYTNDILTESSGLYMQDSGTITMDVTVDAAGSYDLVFYAYGEGGSKQQNVSVNGTSVGVLSIPKGSDYVACEMAAVSLKAGKNTITIEKSWGWTHFDKLVIEQTVLPDIVAYDIVCSDPEIIPEAQSLMNYMASVYGEHIISGQQEIYNYGPHDFEYEFDYIENLTGELPAIRAFDYLNEANILYGSVDGTTDRMIDWVENKGGIITASWHITVPKDFTNFELGKTTIDWSQATYAPKDTDFDTSQILVEGSKEREYWMACLDKLAESIQKLEDRNIPLIFRPLHEAEGGGGETGSWFFWGQDGSAVYKELWRLTYDTLVKDYGLHNIIWEWNSYNFATSADWYPGDDYVDIIGYDKYSCTDWSTGSPVLHHNDSSYASTFYGIMEKYGSNKMVAMAENDSFSTLENITNDKAGWLYFCTWYDGGTDSYGNSVDFLSDPIFNTAEDTKNMYQSEYCITLDELPADLYSTEAPEVPTTTTTTTDPNAPVVTTTTPAYTFTQVVQEVDISDRTETSQFVFVVKGEAGASLGGSLGYGTGAADWVNIEWRGNADADGRLEVTIPLAEIPAEFSTASLQIWWSNTWDAVNEESVDQPAEIESWEIVDDSIPQTTTTTTVPDPIVTTTTVTSTTTGGESIEFTDVIVDITDESITFEENGTFNFVSTIPDKFSGFEEGNKVKVGLWYSETENGKVINYVSYVELISEGLALVYGDADLNGKVEIADVVAIMVHCSTPGGTLSDEAKDCADVYQRGDGVSNMDALAVQKNIAQLITELPESYL